MPIDPDIARDRLAPPASNLEDSRSVASSALDSIGVMHRMHQIWFRLREARRARGLRGVVTLAPRWAVRREFLVFARDLVPTDAELPVPPRLDGLLWTTLDEDAIPRLTALNPLLTDREIRRRQAQGQECLLAWLGGTIVHFRWDTERVAQLPYLGRPFRPLPGDTLAVESFTHPAFRHRGLHSVAVIEALRRAARRGLTRSLTLIAWWNRTALRTGYERAGRHRVGSVGFWGFGRCRHFFTTGAVRRDPRGIFYVSRPGDDA
jgi:GNAT superfamily N-acetyltransferase